MCGCMCKYVVYICVLGLYICTYMHTHMHTHACLCTYVGVCHWISLFPCSTCSLNMVRSIMCVVVPVSVTLRRGDVGSHGDRCYGNFCFFEMCVFVFFFL